MRKLSLFLCLFVSLALRAQTGYAPTPLPLDDRSAFVDPGDNWKIVGHVRVEADQSQELKTSKGTGVLVNRPTEKQRSNLTTRLEHGDLDLLLDVMLAPGSNSGIYLQGRYEVQLLDSWGKQRVGFGDMGGIYERWDDAQPEGQRGYAGVAPRVNVAKAPGLWQQLHIRFRAPRFDAQGRRTEPARILELRLNGVILHENLALTGPTRGAHRPGEAATGPLVFQGDHGPVAFKNVRYRNYSGAPVALKDLTYRSYRGDYKRVPDFSGLTPDDEGPATAISWQQAKTPNEFAIRYTGQLVVPSDGEYRFTLQSSGTASLRIDGQPLAENNYGTITKTLSLAAGEVPFELAYAKAEGWRQGQLGLSVEGAEFRRLPLHTASSAILAKPVAPIFVDARGEVAPLRSFVDYQPTPEAEKIRIIYALNVGHPAGVHYTYDLDNGNVAQVWRGDFIDATPMWNSRGDGNAAPRGSLLHLGLAPPIQQLPDPATPWSDSLKAENQFRHRGYTLDADGHPTISYETLGATVHDQLVPAPQGKGLERRLRIEGPLPAGAYYRVAGGSAVEPLENNTYAVDGQQYRVRLHEGTKATVRRTGNGQELLVPLDGRTSLGYDLVF